MLTSRNLWFLVAPCLVIFVGVSAWLLLDASYQDEFSDKFYQAIATDVSKEERIILLESVAGTSKNKFSKLASIYLAANYLELASDLEAEGNDKQKAKALSVYSNLEAVAGIFGDYAKLCKAIITKNFDGFEENIFYRSSLLLKALAQAEDNFLQDDFKLLEDIASGIDFSENTKVFARDLLKVYKSDEIS